MNKAFVREDGASDDDDDGLPDPEVPKGLKNYMTVAGATRIRAELLEFIDTERPKVVKLVSWAASNGDRSENGDYIYGKKRLREIDRRIHFLTKRLESAIIVDPADQTQRDRVFFGATVTFCRNGSEDEETVMIVGADEVDPSQGHVSWISPVAKALLKATEGDEVELRTPAGVDSLEIVEIQYPDS